MPVTVFEVFSWLIYESFHRDNKDNGLCLVISQLMIVDDMGLMRENGYF